MLSIFGIVVEDLPQIFIESAQDVFSTADAFSGDRRNIKQQIAQVFGFFGIFLYSTFFTSVWLWLYATAGLIVRTTHDQSLAVWARNAVLSELPSRFLLGLPLLVGRASSWPVLTSLSVLSISHSLPRRNGNN